MCDICGSVFVSQKILRSHQKFLHFGELIKCPWCEYSSAAKHLVQGHCARVHKCNMQVRLFTITLSKIIWKLVLFIKNVGTLLELIITFLSVYYYYVEEL